MKEDVQITESKLKEIINYWLEWYLSEDEDTASLYYSGRFREYQMKDEKLFIMSKNNDVKDDGDWIIFTSFKEGCKYMIEINYLKDLKEN